MSCVFGSSAPVPATYVSSDPAGAVLSCVVPAASSAEFTSVYLLVCSHTTHWTIYERFGFFGFDYLEDTCEESLCVVLEPPPRRSLVE